MIEKFSQSMKQLTTDKTYRLDDIYSFDNFSKSWIKFKFILEKLLKFILGWRKSNFFLLMECKNFSIPWKLIDSLWISIRFLIIWTNITRTSMTRRGTDEKKIVKNWTVAELSNKDYTANAFAWKKLKALYLM